MGTGLCGMWGDCVYIPLQRVWFRGVCVSRQRLRAVSPNNVRPRGPANVTESVL